MGANQGRAKGNKQEAEYENRKEGMRDQAGEKGKTEEAKAETGTGKAAVRRNREEKERKNRRLSTGIWKEGMRNQAGEKEETEEARAETGTGKATVRQNREEKERKNRG